MKRVNSGVLFVRDFCVGKFLSPQVASGGYEIYSKCLLSFFVDSQLDGAEKHSREISSKKSPLFSTTR
jgi:hypothetical protein